jgi:hypothetical protein
MEIKRPILWQTLCQLIISQIFNDMLKLDLKSNGICDVGDKYKYSFWNGFTNYFSSIYISFYFCSTILNNGKQVSVTFNLVDIQ